MRLLHNKIFISLVTKLVRGLIIVINREVQLIQLFIEKLNASIYYRDVVDARNLAIVAILLLLLLLIPSLSRDDLCTG